MMEAGKPKGIRGEDGKFCAPWILAGPTASGKSAVAVELAARLPAEIVSVDSRQIYRRMDVGTAKPTPRQRSRVPHHLLDIAEPGGYFSAAAFAERAREAIGAVHRAGRVPLLVGGSGFYLKAVWDGLFKGPARAPDLRRELEAAIERSGPEALHHELAEVDPEAARVIGPRDRARIVRALEVYRSSGRPISEWRRDGAYPDRLTPAAAFKLRRSQDDLRRRIRQRAERMLREGFVREVESLLASGLDPEGPAMRVLGYAEVVQYLQYGGTREGLRDALEKKTWQYARRQMTWFRKEDRLQWIDIPPGETPESTAERMMDGRLLRARCGKV